MKRQYIIFFAVIVFFSSCNLFNPEPDYSITDNDEYDLYNMMIENYAKDLDFFHVQLDINKSRAILHPDSTYNFPCGTPLHYFGNPCDSLMAIDYLSRNDTTHYLDETRLDSPAVGMLRDECHAYFLRESLPRGYEAYYQDYPNSSGIITFSRPGFNPEKTRAVMGYGHSYGMLGGMGGMAIFEKIDGKWKRVRTLYIWMS